MQIHCLTVRRSPSERTSESRPSRFEAYPRARSCIRRHASWSLQGAYTAGHRTSCKQKGGRMTTTMYFIFFIKLERAWGFEPPTPTLARSHANERRNRAPDSQGVRFL